jgi:hypothetical protein
LVGTKKEYYPGLGERIGRRLIELGYVQKNGRPDVLRFAADHGYVSSYLYTWMGKTTPEYQNLRRLAADLRVELGWLGFGDDAREIPKTSLATHEKTPARPRRHRARG